MNIIGLMACATDGVIGLDGKVPWRYLSELKYFQEMIEGSTLVMGRKTFDSISKLSFLKKTKNIIFTTNKTLLNGNSDLNISFVHSLSDFQQLKFNKLENLYMIGGAEIAELFLRNALIQKFLLTHIKHKFTGDTYFPVGLIKEWSVKTIRENKDYVICEYMVN